MAATMTEKQLREAVMTRTKKWMVKEVVEPHKTKLSPAQRERIQALLDQLTS